MMKKPEQDKILFLELLACLTGLCIFFSALYFVLSFSDEHGIAPKSDNYLDYLYFSAVTLSSLGYGDFRPQGLSKLIAGIEVFSGLILLGVYISKIVSLSQEKAINSIISSQHIRGYDDRIRQLQLAREYLSDFRRMVISGNESASSLLNFKYNHPINDVKRASRGISSYQGFLSTVDTTTIPSERIASVVWEFERTVAVILRLIRNLNEISNAWASKSVVSDVKRTVNIIDGFLGDYDAEIRFSFKNARHRMLKTQGIPYAKIDTRLGLISDKTKIIRAEIAEAAAKHRTPNRVAGGV